MHVNGMIDVICRLIYRIMSSANRNNAPSRADRRRQRNARRRGDRELFTLDSSRHVDDGEDGTSESFAPSEHGADTTRHCCDQTTTSEGGGHICIR